VFILQKRIHYEKNIQSKNKRLAKKQQRLNYKQKLRKKRIQEQKQKKTNLVYQTINNNFPDLLEWMDNMEDCRKKKSPYQLAALLTACLAMVRTLIRRKVFYNQRFQGKYYPVAIDGTGVASFKHHHCSQCLSQTSKNGNTTYSHKVVEAHLVTYNGFSISLATEWIEKK